MAYDWPGKAELSEWNSRVFIPAESADKPNGQKFGMDSHCATQALAWMSFWENYIVFVGATGMSSP